MHNPIYISELSLSYGQKLCFSGFNYVIHAHEKIAIIGDNGCGKSSLLKLIAGINDTPVEEISHSADLINSYVPQIILEFMELSGGQRFNQALSYALANYPNLLLLDEPTNHLDRDNRKSLIKLLKNYPATQIIVSHDVELLDTCIDTIWHIHDKQISIFKGKYSTYREQLSQERSKLFTQIAHLNQAKKRQHEDLMKEQQRAKNSREHGEKSIQQRKWPTITSGAKARRAETTSGKNKSYLNQIKSEINNQLTQLWQPEEIKYSFDLTATTANKPIITINSASCGYSWCIILLNNINLTLFGTSKIAFCGPNGSGKSTLIKAIMNDKSIIRTGEWLVPNQQDIAYLDQHYSNLPEHLSITEYILSLEPSFTHSELRKFLNQFLFRKNEEVNNLISVLSGGEKARLSLAVIALQQPKLLILDEITNNIDLTTREHITQVLKTYQGAMIIISHDISFLDAIKIDREYDLQQWQII